MITRRAMLRTSLLAGGAVLSGARAFSLPQSSRPHSGMKGRKVGTIDFIAEGNVPMDSPVGSELDGRLFTDLSNLPLGTRTIPTDRFFIRTRASQLLEDQQPWMVRCNGLLRRQVGFSPRDVEKMSHTSGLHLIECSGNISNAHFGMLGVAEWSGVRIVDILSHLPAQPRTRLVMISGFDQYIRSSVTSVPGASWVFTADQLVSAGALLATHMNGVKLSPDHGAPLRLIVPNWYGCTCIKWVNQIMLVKDEVPATSQMQEYASRTMQSGTPSLARDFQPAKIEPAAMPIRVEQWKFGEKTRYRIVGVCWGQAHLVRLLQIRFNSQGEYARVELHRDPTTPWVFWTYDWVPPRPGIYSIQLKVKEPQMKTRRLDQGYYIRTVQVSES